MLGKLIGFYVTYRTQTYNPRLRKLMSYPLGARNLIHKLIVHAIFMDLLIIETKLETFFRTSRENSKILILILKYV